MKYPRAWGVWFTMMHGSTWSDFAHAGNVEIYRRYAKAGTVIVELVPMPEIEKLIVSVCDEWKNSRDTMDMAEEIQEQLLERLRNGVDSDQEMSEVPLSVAKQMVEDAEKAQYERFERVVARLRKEHSEAETYLFDELFYEIDSGATA